MIPFDLFGNEYRIEGTILPVGLLTQYPHEIDRVGGNILLPYSAGDWVMRYPTTQDKAKKQAGERRQVSGFSVVGGRLCCRFFEGGGCHDVECIAPLDLFTNQ